jgi:hypothetical protein
VNGSPVDPFNSFFDNLGDAAAWQRALERAAAPDPVVPYLKTDEERALDAEDWAIYANENQRAQREVSDRAEAGKRALTALHRLSTTQRRHRERFRCFCPDRLRPCRLAVAYAWPGPAGSPMRGRETLLLIASGAKKQRASFPEWDLEGERLDPANWLPVACRHGTGRFPNDVPGQVIGAVYTAASVIHSRRITDLLGVSGVAWVSRTPMLSR